MCPIAQRKPRTMKTLTSFVVMALAHLFLVSSAQAQWSVLDTPWPAGATTQAFLVDVEALGNTDVWAVGHYVQSQPGGSLHRFALVMHWDGSAWSIIPAPSPGSFSELRAVEGAASDDVWAVGVTTGAGFNPRALLLHWDGSSWSEFPTPLTSATFSQLSDLEVLGTNDIWFCGDMSSSAGSQTLPTTLHWDGSSFDVQTAPTLNTSGHTLEGIVAFPSGEVWAVGGGPQALSIPTYIVRWTGTQWLVVSAPEPGFIHGLNAIDGVAPNDIWAVGAKQDASGLSQFTLHFDGSQWTEFSSPGGSSDLLALTSDEVYSAGGLISVWNGASWQVHETFAGVNLPATRGVDITPDGTLWTVGAQRLGNINLPMSARRDGSFGTANAFCFGDGGDQMGCTNCPCVNNSPLGSQGGCINSTGTAGTLGSSGSSSIASGDLRIRVTFANPLTFGVLVSGDNRLPSGIMNPCFGLDSGILSPGTLDGLRCVGGNLARHGTRATDDSGDIGFTNSGWGPPDGPSGGIAAQAGFTAGQTRHFQCFYRESAVAVCATGLNTTNGVTIQFMP